MKSSRLIYNGPTLAINDLSNPLRHSSYISISQTKDTELDKDKSCINYPFKKYLSYRDCDDEFVLQKVYEKYGIVPFWATKNYTNVSGSRLIFKYSHKFFESPKILYNRRFCCKISVALQLSPALTKLQARFQFLLCSSHWILHPIFSNLWIKKSKKWHLLWYKVSPRKYVYIYYMTHNSKSIQIVCDSLYFMPNLEKKFWPCLIWLLQ